MLLHRFYHLVSSSAKKEKINAPALWGNLLLLSKFFITFYLSYFSHSDFLVVLGLGLVYTSLRPLHCFPLLLLLLFGLVLSFWNEMIVTHIIKWLSLCHPHRSCHLLSKVCPEYSNRNISSWPACSTSSPCRFVYLYTCIAF